jgi:hypothetical protein
LTLASSTLAQVGSPSGAAMGRIGTQTYVFNGIETFLPGELEAYRINGQGVLTDAPGSPQADPPSSDGPYALFDSAHAQVLESETLGFSALGIYGVRHGALAFLGRTTPPPSGGFAPTAMVELGTTVYVVNVFGDIMDACVIGNGTGSCTLAATLAGYNGHAEGIGVL